MKTLSLLIFLFLSGSLYADNSSKTKTHELKIVKQVYDINAATAGEMYQFIPDYLEINTGDTVKFLGTFGRHTVHSVKGMAPEGTPKIAIMPRQPNEVKFDTAGIYGIKCKIHQRHGMVSLIVVGGDLHNMKKSRDSVKQGVSTFTVPKMHKLLDKAEAAFGKVTPGKSKKKRVEEKAEMDKK